ncbi:MAG: DUF4255 domain-containing protein [Methanophagales archaeon ANME-1-THS]|nr:MAG: DUF4255 domain-containing protein [Methanophagales archaeon ANME-1-THS]
MGEYTAIADVGETLKKLLWGHIKDDPVAKSILESEEQITFSSPEELEADKRLSLFLYHVTENAYLKNEELQRINSTRLKYPPLALSLFYLVTPHTQKRENDHILLGKVMQILHDNAILRGSVLQGRLAGEELRIILNPLSIDELNKIWNVISKSRPFKLSASYEVTPLRIASLREREVKRVIERHFENYLVRGEDDSQKG